MMDREIEFRGKRKDNGEWVYGNLVVMNDGVWIIPQSYDAVSISKSTCCGLVEVDPGTVGQYTGRKIGDVKLYEGDKVEYHNGVTEHSSKFPQGKKIYKTGVVIFENSSWSLGGNLFLSNGSIEGLKIIGDIHEPGNERIATDGE